MGVMKLINERRLLLGFVAFLILIISYACTHSDGPYRGKVVELETGNPAEGAVVAAEWTIEPFVHSERICDAKETITDKNGGFELPEGSCISHPFAAMYKPYVVVFKPGYLSYPPSGNTPEERRAKMPDFTGKEFKDENQYYIIKLGKPKTRKERELTLTEAEFILDDEVLRKLPTLLKLTNEENKNLGLGERRPAK